MSHFEQKLAQVDLTPVMQIAERETTLDATLRERAEDLYRKFLTLKAMYPNKDIVPPKLADTLWHCHMLDSRKYQADCEKLFGNFIHHNPHFLGEPLQRAWAETRDLFKQTFGLDPEDHAFTPEEWRGATSCG